MTDQSLESLRSVSHFVFVLISSNDAVDCNLSYYPAACLYSKGNVVPMDYITYVYGSYLKQTTKTTSLPS